MLIVDDKTILVFGVKKVMENIVGMTALILILPLDFLRSIVQSYISTFQFAFRLRHQNSPTDLYKFPNVCAVISLKFFRKIWWKFMFVLHTKSSLTESRGCLDSILENYSNMLDSLCPFNIFITCMHLSIYLFDLVYLFNRCHWSQS